jgi:hypothetical protein
MWYRIARKEASQMPHRFQLLEKIAFSLVVFSAVACSAFIAYERCPEIKIALHEGEDPLSKSGEYSLACVAPANGPCAQLPVD